MLSDKNRMAMGVFILSESIFFLLLIIAYINFHIEGQKISTAARYLNFHSAIIFSLFLFSSSFTLWRAEANLKHHRRSRVPFWLGLTIVLGAVFLFGQGREYYDLIHRNMTISRDLFGTTFFTLTGFHGLHVLMGLLLLVIMLILALFGRKDEPRESALGAIGYYWHFVDAVWVVVFSVVYLWAFL
jgi:heme/copper-type cytochrome/quinol oxidase subunit 3